MTGYISTSLGVKTAVAIPGPTMSPAAPPAAGMVPPSPIARPTTNKPTSPKQPPRSMTPSVNALKLSFLNELNEFGNRNRGLLALGGLGLAAYGRMRTNEDMRDAQRTRDEILLRQIMAKQASLLDHGKSYLDGLGNFTLDQLEANSKTTKRPMDPRTAVPGDRHV